MTSASRWQRTTIRSASVVCATVPLVLALLSWSALGETPPSQLVEAHSPTTALEGMFRPAGTSLREFLGHMNYVLIEEISPEGDLQPAAVLIVGRKGASPARPGPSSMDGRLAPGGSQPRLDLVTETLLSDPNAAIRRWAVEQLSERSDGGTFVQLTQALDDADAAVRSAALGGLEQYGAAAIGLIETRIQQEPVAAVRVAALEMLGRAGESNAVPYLKDLLNDRDIEIRVAAVAALGRISNPVAVQTLLGAIQHRDPAVRMAALDALVFYAPVDAADAAIENAFHDGDAGVASLAADLADVVRQRYQAPLESRGR